MTIGAPFLLSSVETKNSMYFSREKRRADQLLKGLEPLSLYGINLPTDAEWERITHARKLLGAKVEKQIVARLERYDIAIRAREDWRESVGMDEQGVTAGMRAYLARTKDQVAPSNGVKTREVPRSFNGPDGDG